jgi:hypothetical protein
MKELKKTWTCNVGYLIRSNECKAQTTKQNSSTVNLNGMY